jgi:N-acetylglucosaminyldiphosphoundecaprenol N-acetyl-beta-D-mannosaminyltransferase
LSPETNPVDRPDARDAGLRTVEIDGLPVHDLVFDEVVSLIVEWAREGSGGYINTPNVDHVVRARRDPVFRRAVLEARLRIPDGMGIVYGSRLAGKALRGTVTGRLLPEAVARASADDPIPTALIGGRDDAPAKAARRLDALGARMVAAIGPPMGFAVGSAEDLALVERLKSADPRLLYVGFGAPKQEMWMTQHRAALPRTLMLGVGYAIDALGGRTRTAPDWMRRTGMEWAFRLAHDPRRIGRRVFIDDPPFFWWMLRERLKRRRRLDSHSE